MWLSRRYNDVPTIWNDFPSFFERDLLKSFQQQESNIEIVNDKIEITVIAPGLVKEDFDISFQDRYLTVSYDISEKNKRYVGQKKFKQVWQLPVNTKPFDILATYEQGVLKITLPSSKKDPPEIYNISVK